MGGIMKDRYMFRGKGFTVDNEKKWFYGAYLDGKILDYVSLEYPFESEDVSGCEIDIETLGQCTGLKFSNKLAFEGDLFKSYSIDFEPGLYKIVHINGSFVGIGVDIDEEISFGLDVDLNDFTIIGNIHDNPELLEEK
jgi:uncharacterized phage protein (TIGR01671 family)